jgi:hypothetical protein
VIGRQKLWRAAAVNFDGLLRLAAHLRREGRLPDRQCLCGATACTERLIEAVARGLT